MYGRILVSRLTHSQFQEVVNRPWAQDDQRKKNGCVGQDFIFFQPKFVMRFFWNAEQRKLVGAVQWFPNSEGPPGGSHGGSIASAFDEILAYMPWKLLSKSPDDGLVAFTANLSVNYKKMVPFASCQRFTAQVDKVEGRKLWVSAKLISPDGDTTYADANGMWIAAPRLPSKL